MLTFMLLTGCVTAFVWGIKKIASEQYAQPLEILAVVGSPLVAIGALLASCWEAALGLILAIVVGIAIVRSIGAIFANVGGGQLLKGMVVVFAMVIALPPFWPVSIPLALCLAGGVILLAPLGLLASVIRGFFGEGE